jgi:hypothetical protein
MKTDPERESNLPNNTGIYVRAMGADGRWDSFDISQLDRDSLHEWLRSRGGENLWAENVVLTLLGHEQIDSVSK